MRWFIKIILNPTWKWCKKHGNWYLYNPKQFYESDECLIPFDTQEFIDYPLSSEYGDTRYLFVNCGKSINFDINKMSREH